MIDSHSHIHDARFDDDRDAMMARAKTAGIETLIAIGCDLEDSALALAAANRYGAGASVGIHPHEAREAPADIAAAFAPLLADPRTRAIGEIGLDYYYDHSPREVQRRVLREQLRIARERGLPTIFHQRDAYDDFVTILREEFVPGMRGVVHCFTGDAAQARAYVEEFGLLLGIGGVLTFKAADALREAVLAVGLEPLLLETDCPYLAPVPMRGQRNEPAFMTHTLHALAHLLGKTPSEVDAATSAATRALFTLAE